MTTYSIEESLLRRRGEINIISTIIDIYLTVYFFGKRRPRRDAGKGGGLGKQHILCSRDEEGNLLQGNETRKCYNASCLDNFGCTFINNN